VEPLLESVQQIALHASDLDQSIAFYRDKLGARFVATFDPPGLAFFEVGGVRLLLERGVTPGTVYFRVADIWQAHQALVGRGVGFESEPHPIHRDDAGLFGPAGETEWMAFFRDPGGNLLAIAARK
jgi:catechol 2,3-dioxygenase-like lactoylglutathione lyase family enzyme